MPEHALVEQLDQAIEAVLAGRAPSVDAPLAETIYRLRDLPDPDFKTRLKNELQRRASMTASAVAPIREGFRTITPYIMVPEGGDLIEFLKKTFGAEELVRNPSSSGFHAEVRIGDSILMIGGGESLRGRERIGAFHAYVPDCDAVYRLAMDAGATSLGEPADRPYGERSGFVKDVAGNHWYIATRLGSALAQEGVGSVVPFVHPQGALKYIEFLKQAFGAQEMAVFERGGMVMHAAVRIGDAVLEMGEAHDESASMHSAYYMYVEDADAIYERALAAGATSLWPPTDQPYGDRMAGLQDPFGYQWFPATRIR
jgi:uncharacterized glyoxalase superfamily protein PhnB